MHTIKNCKFILLFLCIPALFLNACVTGKGYKNIPSAQRAPASSAPGEISSPAGDSKQQASFRIPDNLKQVQDFPPTKVAILLPLSGKHADIGNAMLNAAQMALFDVGYPSFSILPRDTQGTPDGARKAAKDAAREGAELVIGPLFATSVKAVQPVVRSRGINMIAFSTDWTLAGRNTFIMGFMPFDQLERVAEFAGRNNVKTIGILSPDNSYGQIVANSFSRLAPQYGMQVTDNVSFHPHSPNLAPTIRAFTHFDARKAQDALASRPYDAVLMPVGGEDARSIANLLTHNNLPPRSVIRIGTGLLDDPALATEQNLEGAWFAAPSPISRKNFENKYQRTFGKKAPRLTSLAYDATALAATLARQGFSTGDRPAFGADAIANPNGFAGIDGIFRFRSNGTVERGLAVLSYQRGRIVVLDDAPITFVKPMPPKQPEISSN